MCIRDRRELVHLADRGRDLLDAGAGEGDHWPDVDAAAGAGHAPEGDDVFVGCVGNGRLPAHTNCADAFPGGKKANPQAHDDIQDADDLIGGYR